MRPAEDVKEKHEELRLGSFLFFQKGYFFYLFDNRSFNNVDRGIIYNYVNYSALKNSTFRVANCYLKTEVSC